MQFESVVNTRLNYYLIFIIIFMIIFFISLLFSKILSVKGGVSIIVGTMAIIILWGYNYFNYGIKKIEFPDYYNTSVLKGNHSKNEYIKAKDIKNQIKYLNGFEIEEINYNKALDPGYKNGVNGGFGIVYNNGKVKWIITDEYDYMRIDYNNELKLYKIVNNKWRTD